MAGLFDDLIPQKPAAGSMFGATKPPTAQQAMAMQQRQANLNALANKYADVRDRYNRDLKGVGISSLLEYLPLPKNKAFNSAASGLSDLALAAFRVPGVGAQSDRELQAFVQANQPSNWDSDQEIEAKLGNIRNRLTASGVVIPGEQPDNGGFRVIRRR